MSSAALPFELHMKTPLAPPRPATAHTNATAPSSRCSSITSHSTFALPFLRIATSRVAVLVEACGRLERGYCLAQLKLQLKPTPTVHKRSCVVASHDVMGLGTSSSCGGKECARKVQEAESAAGGLIVE